MGKRFLGGVAAFAVLAALAACAGDANNAAQPASLPGPRDLIADVDYEGIVILKWNVVANAAGYAVVRRDTVSRISVALKESFAENYYVDIVGWDNQLVDGRSYEYTVIALSNSSTASGAPAGGSGGHIQNGESKVSAKPKIPADFTPALSEDEISLSQYADFDGADKIMVRFPNKPNYRYKVAYSFGTGELVREFEELGEDRLLPGQGLALYEAYRVATFPTIGGNNSVTVKAWFAGDLSFYSASAEAIKAADFSLSGWLGSPYHFSATRPSGSDDIMLAWSNVEGAARYEIWKAPVNAFVSDPRIGNPNVTVGGNWELLEQGDDFFPELTDSGWLAFETGASMGYYVYMIFAIDDKGVKSAPSFAGVDRLAVETPRMSLSHSDDPLSFSLSWPTNEGDEYALEYARVISPVRGEEATESSYRLDGAYADISGKIDFAPLLGSATVIMEFEPGQEGSNYIFKLASSRGEASGTPTYRILNEGAFSTLVSFDLQRVSASHLDADAIILELGGATNVYRGRSYDIKLYRKQAGGFYTEIPAAAGAYSPPEAGEPHNWRYEDAGLDVSGEYQYRIEAVGHFAASGTGESSLLRPYGYGAFISSNYLQYNSTGAAIYLDSDGAVADAPGDASGLAAIPASGLVFFINPSGSNSNINGLGIQIQYGNASGGQTAEWVTISRAEAGASKFYYVVLPAAADPDGTDVRLLKVEGSASNSERAFVTIAAF